MMVTNVSPGARFSDMAAPTYRSEGNKRFADSDAAEMERRIARIAGAWRKRLRCDPAIDIEDLEQELRLWYWIYWLRCGHPKYDSRLRGWARSIMRMWGYCGPDHDDKGLFHSPRLDAEVSFSNHAATREFDLTDEEIVDAINYQRSQGRGARLTDDES